MRKLLIIVIGICMFVAHSPAQASPTPAKWGRHKKAQPFVIPDAPFPFEMVDPRQNAVLQYLDKKLAELRDDLPKYPNLKDQLQGLIDEITALKDVPVSDPDFAARFGSMHTTLLSVWTMESNDAI